MRAIGTLFVKTDTGEKYEAILYGTNCPCSEGIRVWNAPNELGFIRGKGLHEAGQLIKSRGWHWSTRYE